MSDCPSRTFHPVCCCTANWLALAWGGYLSSFWLDFGYRRRPAFRAGCNQARTFFNTVSAPFTGRSVGHYRCLPVRTSSHLLECGTRRTWTVVSQHEPRSPGPYPCPVRIFRLEGAPRRTVAARKISRICSLQIAGQKTDSLGLLNIDPCPPGIGNQPLKLIKVRIEAEHPATVHK